MRQSWYHDGVVGLGDSLGAVADGLGSRLSGYSRKIFIGNSMGGFAALFFGQALTADAVVAFDPQTFISPSKRLRHQDFRWGRQVRGVHWRWGLRSHVFDLASYRFPMAKVHVGGGMKLDVIHARNITDSGAEIVIRSGAKHDLVKQYRASGELEDILRNVVNAAASISSDAH